MLDTETVLNEIKNIPIEVLAAMVRESLEEAGIPYEVGSGQIEYPGLQLDSSGYRH